MKMKLAILFVASLMATPVLAEKPEWAGQGKATDEQKELHRAAMEAKGDDLDEDRIKDKGDKVKKEKDKAKKDKAERSKEDRPKGLDKQREKKSEQERKEVGKGSEQGQQSREESSKKWWKFWEE